MISDIFKKFFGNKKNLIDETDDSEFLFTVKKGESLYVTNKDICETLNFPGTKYYKLEDNKKVNIYLRCRYCGIGNKQVRESLQELIDNLNTALNCKAFSVNEPLEGDVVYNVNILPLVDLKSRDYIHYIYEANRLCVSFIVREPTAQDIADHSEIYHGRSITGLVDIKNVPRVVYDRIVKDTKSEE